MKMSDEEYEAFCDGEESLRHDDYYMERAEPIDSDPHSEGWRDRD